MLMNAAKIVLLVVVLPLMVPAFIGAAITLGWLPGNVADFFRTYGIVIGISLGLFGLAPFLYPMVKAQLTKRRVHRAALLVAQKAEESE